MLDGVCHRSAEGLCPIPKHEKTLEFRVLRLKF